MQAIILLVILIFLNAVFASAEIAVLSMSETKLRKLVEEGDKRALKLNSLVEQPARFLATIQVAITLAGFLQSAFAADTFADPLAASLVEAGVPVPERVLRSAAIVLITIILSYFTLVFGELVPKRLAMKKSEQMALGMSGILYLVAKVFAPLVWLLTVSTNLVLRLMGISPEEEEDQVTEEEIRMLLMEGSQQGNIQLEETQMIRNVFEFDDISVDEICTHRRETVMLYLEDSLEEWDEVIRSHRYTQYPVVGESQDDIIGVLDTKDYFRLNDRNRENVLAQCVEEAYLIPESMKANVLFRQMKEKHVYFAILIDEYGGMRGIITDHDLIEALVGDLDDEEEAGRPEDIRRLGENCWKIQGGASLDQVEEAVGVKLPTDVFDTFSGYIWGLAGRVPDDGERFVWETDELEIRILGVENHVIKEAVVRKKEKEL